MDDMLSDASIHLSHRCSFSSSCTSMTLVAVRPNKLSMMDANSYSVTVRSSRHKRNFIVFRDSFRLRQLHTIFPFRIRLHSWIIKPLRFFSMWRNYLFRRVQKNIHESTAASALSDLTLTNGESKHRHGPKAEDRRLFLITFTCKISGSLDGM